MPHLSARCLSPGRIAIEDALPTTDQPPAYLLVTAQVSDPVRLAAYARALSASGLYARHGGRYLFIGKAATPLEDWPVTDSVVCAIFPNRAAAEAFWADPEYQDSVKPLRAGAGEFHVAIFDGLAGTV